MIHFELNRDQKILSITPEGPLKSEDFQKLAAAVDPVIADGGDLKGLLIDAPAFPGWSGFADMVSHMTFVKDHQRHIQRIAVVSDNGFLSVMPRVASHFVQGEVRHFAAGQKEEALAWLSD